MTEKFFHKNSKIIAREKINPDTFRIKLEQPQIAGSALPGQFLHIKIGDKPLRRPLAIFNRDKDLIEILFKVRGEGTMALSKKKKGEIIDLLGPLGKPFPELGERPLFIAGGIGIVPLNFLARRINKKGILIYGARKKEDFAPLSPMKHKVIKISEEKNNQCATDVLPQFIKQSDIVYVSGPRAMMKTAARICRENNVNGYLTWEERMGCGIGLCHGCTVSTRRGNKDTCKEGPVFGLDDINWDEY